MTFYSWSVLTAGGVRGHITGRRALANRPTTPTTAPTPASTPEPTATPTLTAVQLRNERATAVLITLPGYDPVQHAARLPLVPARLRRAAGKERRPLTRQEGRSLHLYAKSNGRTYFGRMYQTPFEASFFGVAGRPGRSSPTAARPGADSQKTIGQRAAHEPRGWWRCRPGPPCGPGYG